MGIGFLDNLVVYIHFYINIPAHEEEDKGYNGENAD